MDSPIPLTRDLVFIGGGHAHALVLRQWGMAPLPGARLTLINPDPVAPYTGMLPGHVAGHYGRDDLMIDLVRLARFAGARLILGKAAGLDLKAKQIHVPGRPPIRYDVASIDVGITADMPDLPGFRDYGIGAKPLDRFADAWDAYIARVKSGEKTGQVAVIGGGVAGCELALAMHHRLTDMGVSPHICIIERATALQGADEKSQTQLRDRLKSASIVLKEQCSVQRLTAEGVVTETNDVIPAELTIGAAGARPHDWLAHQGLEHEAGFLTVDRFLRSVSDHSIYAAGDCAHMKGSPRPKAGVFAVRQAPILLANLRADLSRGPRRVFKPQKRFLKLISLGGKDAIAEGYGINPSGPWLWRLKDKIDRDFMHKLSTLPRMAQASPRGPVAAGVAQALSEKPLCGGCGAKVSGSTLNQILTELPAPERQDVTVTAGDDAAVLDLGQRLQVLTTDHLRALTDDPVILTRIAVYHAMGDIWAMGAEPQAATATIILPRMSAEMQAATLQEITQTAVAALRSVGAELVGGHTTLGAELTIGFSLTGLCGNAPIRLSGARPGDKLLLTRPIGSGVLLAAEMQYRAKGADIANLWRTMAMPQADAAAILSHAHAMTDVTGFGLAGHLLRMCQASKTGAHLQVNEIPLFNGALDLAGQGMQSTLTPANKQDTSSNIDSTITGPAVDLLFDPQTSGGLLAAVAASDAASLLTQLQGAGYRAGLIGEITAEAPMIKLS